MAKGAAVATVWVLVCGLLLAAGSQEPAESDEVPATTDELKARIVRILDETGTPGAAVALVSDGGLAWSDGMGWADAAAKTPATAETLFRAGSISKSFVALSVLMLREEGLLDLDARVADVAPEVGFRNPFAATEPLRLVHLLEHTSGFDDIHLSEYAGNDPTPLDLADALARYSASRTCRWPPGTFMSYSNAGPAVAAYIVGKTAGMPFERFVAERIFAPLGIERADFRLTPEVEGLLSRGYSPGGKTELPYWHIAFRPAGALNISVNELAKAVLLLIDRGVFNGKRLLTAESIERMEVPRTTLAAHSGILTGYGLSNYTIVDRGFVFHGHAGGVNAFAAEYGYLPFAGRGYVCMINTAAEDPLDRILGVVRSYLTRDLETPVAPEPIAIPRTRLRALAGYYRPITPRQEITRAITRLTGVLWVQDEAAGLRLEPFRGEPVELLAVTDRRFRGEDEPLPTTVFVDTARGLVLLRTTPSGRNYRAVSVGMVWLERATALVCLVLMFSSLLSALSWMVTKLFGRPADTERPSVRLVPLASVLCLAGAVGIWMTAANDLIARMGNATLWSVSFWLLNWLFAILALLGLLHVLRSRRWKVAPMVRLHSLAVSAANVTVAAYLFYWGIVGWRPWS